MDIKYLTLKANVSFEGLKETLEECWKLKVPGKMIMKWAEFYPGETFSTELTEENWAEIAKLLATKGGNDILDFSVQEGGEVQEMKGDV